METVIKTGFLSFNHGRYGKRNLLTASILFSSSLAWFYIFHVHLLDLILRIPGTDLIYVSIGKLLFYIATVVSGIGGSLLSEKVERRRLLFFCVTLAFLSTISLTILEGWEISLLLSILLGVSFGLPFPIYQALLTESTKIVSRGRIAGIVISCTFAIVVIILLLATFLGLAKMDLVIICVALNATSFLALLAGPVQREIGPRRTWSDILYSANFSRYAVPWLIFNIANGLLFLGKISAKIESVAVAGSALEFFITIFTALAAGFLADRIGRKQPMIAGLVILGIGYAFFGLVASVESYLTYLIVEGIAWGLIAVIYMQVILGDISADSGSKERYYAVGGLMIPFLTRTAFSVGQELTGLTVPVSWLSTVLSIITFLSVIPLLRAPETLPEQLIRKRQIKEHIDKVGKAISESEENE